MDSHELLQFLQRMRSLVELRIELPACVDDTLLNALCYRETNEQHLVPHLKTLRVWVETLMITSSQT